MKFIALIGLVALNLNGYSEPVHADTTKLVAETNHSTILFTVPISNGLTRITGKFNEFAIMLGLVDNDILKSTLHASIQVSSIDTGIPARDNDLLSETFFDATRYPAIIFTSSSITKKGKGYLARGQLQMHGITRNVELPFIITGKKDDNVIGFECRTSIKRTDYAVATTFKHTTDDNFIGNDIGVEINFWTRKPKEKK